MLNCFSPLPTLPFNLNRNRLEPAFDKISLTENKLHFLSPFKIYSIDFQFCCCLILQDGSVVSFFKKRKFVCGSCSWQLHLKKYFEQAIHDTNIGQNILQCFVTSISELYLKPAALPMKKNIVPQFFLPLSASEQVTIEYLLNTFSQLYNIK